MSDAITAALRRAVRERAGRRCEYCRLAEEDAFFPHEPDHVIALKHGGATDVMNLALACFDCNRYKGSDIATLDPLTGALTALFNPRAARWEDHFRPDGGEVVPQTSVGRATTALLRLNKPSRVEVRAELARAGRWPATVPRP